MTTRFLPATVLLCAAFPVFGGSSLVLTPGVTSASVADPNLAAGQSWRAEFQMHDWTVPSGPTDIWDLNGIGAKAQLLPGGVLRFFDKRDSVTPSVCGLTLVGYINVLVRVQREVPANRFVCELWNYDGTGYTQNALTITNMLAWPYGGGRFGDAYTAVSLGFFRIFSTTVPDGSQAPVTATAGDLTDLKFDGNTKDDSGNRHGVSFPGAVFANTPGQRPFAVIKTAGAPFWSNVISFRAGYPATLDATASYSLADASSAVSYQWQEVSGPTTVKWSARDSATPTVTGLIFGTYRFRLQVSDASNKTASMDLDVGAVATDDNGVVIQANPAADLIFGPMIALGKNPWQYEDYIALHSAQLRSTAYAAISPPSWINNLAGTISYQPFYNTTSYQTTLAGAIAATDTTIALSDATKLDFSTLPTVIQIGYSAPAMEEVRICNAAGNTLTVCFDGRGWRQGLWNEVTAPQAWASGTQVTQMKTAGMGTQFLTDFCPAGPGEEGQIVSTAGTLSVTPNSTVLMGSGTAWSTSLAGLRIRVSGTHSGTPFFFFAGVAAVNSATSITLTRAYPAAADAGGGLSYAIINPGRFIARGWLRSDGTTGQQKSPVSSCESDTQMYHSGADSIANTNTAPQTGQQYSWSATTWVSDAGPNYYDEVLAEYAGYLRSGLALFLNNAHSLGDYWAKNPELDEGYVGNSPRRVGATGLVAAAVLDNRSSNWTAIRKLASNAITGGFSGGAILSPCDTDVREDAYGLSWIALDAMFDPDPAQKAYAQSQLPLAYVRDEGCKNSDGSFAQPFYTGSQGSFTLTHGSTTAAGTSIPASVCNVISSGTITVTNGSSAATGTGFPTLASGARIVIRGTHDGGQYYLYWATYNYNSTTSVTLTGTGGVIQPWAGDSGTFTYQIEGDNAYLSFATSDTDPNLMVSPLAVPVLFGAKWAAAIGPLRWLALFMILRTIRTLTEQVLNSQLMTRFTMRMSIFNFVIMPIAFIAAVPVRGISGVAAAWLVLSPLTIVPLALVLLRHIDLTYRRFFTALLPALAGSAVMFVTVDLLQNLLRADAWSPKGMLALLTAAGATVYAIVILGVFRERILRYLRFLMDLREGKANPVASLS